VPAAARRSRSWCRPGHTGSTATRREHTNRIPLPKTGTTRSVTNLAPPLNR
jgi:hypothetical protein